MLKSSVTAGKVSRVVVCGFKGCGKTSVLEQLIYGNHVAGQPKHATIEDIYFAHIDTDRGIKEKVLFYDMAGMDSASNEVSRVHLPHADGFVLVYSVNSSESFSLLDSLKKDIDKHKEKKEVSIIILGNKKDLSKERQVDFNTAQAWAQKEKAKLFEVSVTDRRTLIEPFVYLTSRMNPPPSKSTFPPLVRKGKTGSIPMEL